MAENSLKIVIEETPQKANCELIETPANLNTCIGFELYFLFLKQTSCCFLVVSLVSLWPIIENSTGEGIQPGMKHFNVLSVANQSGVSDSSKQTRLLVADFLCTLVFMLFGVYYTLSSKVLVRKKLESTVSEHSLQVKKLPLKEVTTEEVKHHFSQFGSVVEVCLARKYKGVLRKLKLNTELSTQDQLVLKNPQELFVDRAFVVFESTHSKKMCLKLYKGCFKTPSYLKFKSDYKLKVKEAPEPLDILWENLELPLWKKLLRLACVSLVSRTFLVFTVSIVYYIKTVDDQFPKDCTLETSSSLEFAKAHYNTSSEALCWCQGQSWEELNSKHTNEFCEEFIDLFRLSMLVKFLGGICIVLLNNCIKWLSKKLSRFLRFETKTAKNLYRFKSSFFSMLKNTLLAFFLINTKTYVSGPFEESLEENNLKDVENFSKEWYQGVGSTITCILMTYLVLSSGMFLWSYLKPPKQLSTSDMPTQVSEVLTVLAFFAYSGGMPLLNIMCGFAVVVFYLKEKFLFKFCEKPYKYTKEFNNSFITVWVVLGLLHCYNSAMAYKTTFQNNLNFEDPLFWLAVSFVFLVVFILSFQKKIVDFLSGGNTKVYAKQCSTFSEWNRQLNSYDMMSNQSYASLIVNH